MSRVVIPEWNSQGVLPPINQDFPTNLHDRSPYTVSLTDIVLRFGIHHNARKFLIDSSLFVTPCIKSDLSMDSSGWTEAFLSILR